MPSLLVTSEALGALSVRPPAEAGVYRKPAEARDPAALVRALEAHRPGPLALDLDHERPAQVGIALGACQWYVLRTHFPGSGWWTLAYALGLPLSFVVGLVVSFSIGFEWENVDAIFRVVSLAFFGAVAGAVFGMLSGGLLVWFLRHPRLDAKLAAAF